MSNAAAISLSRQLHSVGDKKGAFAALAKQLYGVGYADELRDELERLFLITPDVTRKLADLDQRLRSEDVKLRKQAARQASGDHLSADGLNFLYYPQARSLLIEHLANDDPAVCELMAFALANCFRGYVLDQRAYRPLLPLLASKLPNTRAWACEALALLGDQAAADVLPLTRDQSERVWQAAFSALNFGLEGGGTLERVPWGLAARRLIAQAMLQIDRDREVAYATSLLDHCLLHGLQLRAAELTDRAAAVQAPDDLECRHNPCDFIGDRPVLAIVRLRVPLVRCQQLDDRWR